MDLNSKLRRILHRRNLILRLMTWDHWNTMLYEERVWTEKHKICFVLSYLSVHPSTTTDFDRIWYVYDRLLFCTVIRFQPACMYWSSINERLFVMLNLVVCILLRVLDQVQGFRQTQHCLNSCLIFYSIIATCFHLKMVIRPTHVAVIE
jgi:hypothetical protein